MSALSVHTQGACNLPDLTRLGRQSPALQLGFRLLGFLPPHAARLGVATRSRSQRVRCRVPGEGQPLAHLRIANATEVLLPLVDEAAPGHGLMMPDAGGRDPRMRAALIERALPVNTPGPLRRASGTSCGPILLRSGDRLVLAHSKAFALGRPPRKTHTAVATRGSTPCEVAGREWRHLGAPGKRIRLPLSATG